MTETTIEWTRTIGPDGKIRPGKTWNPFRARNLETGNEGTYCEQISAGCANCYAETLNQARRWNKGTGLPYAHSARGKVEHFIDWGMVRQALAWQGSKVFVDSMSDLFGEWMSYEDIDIVVAVARLNPSLTLQLLTKRARNMLIYFNEWEAGHEEARGMRMQRAVDRLLANVGDMPRRRWPAYDGSWPLPNIWPGVTAENQEMADKRLPDLVRITSVLHWVSYEPAIGPADFHPWAPLLDWVVVGGETGAASTIRPFNLEWARDVIRQGKEGQFAVFVKQMGQAAYTDNQFAIAAAQSVGRSINLAKNGAIARVDYRFTGHGRDMEEWPGDLRVQEFPR